MSLFNLSMEYERMRIERDTAVRDRGHLLEWLTKVENDVVYYREEINERLHLLTYLALENHVNAARAPVLPHWTEEQRAALRRGMVDRVTVRSTTGDFAIAHSLVGHFPPPCVPSDVVPGCCADFNSLRTKFQEM